MAKFAHFLLTVFNVRLTHGGSISPDDAWMQHRFRLFDDFCFPSVRAQTNAEFTWLVLFDATTPEPYKERIAHYAAWKPFVPCYVNEVMTIESFAAMKDQLIDSRLPQGTTHLITTNLDNDDSIHTQFVENIQRQFAGQRCEFLNFTNGFLFDTIREQLYVRRHRSNPFASLVETIEGSKTVWCAAHPVLSQFGPMRQIEADPMWLQGIHGRNVSNSIADARRVPLEQVTAGFDAVRVIPRRKESWGTIAVANLAIGARKVVSRLTGN